MLSTTRLLVQCYPSSRDIYAGVSDYQSGFQQRGYLPRRAQRVLDPADVITYICEMHSSGEADARWQGDEFVRSITHVTLQQVTRRSFHEKSSDILDFWSPPVNGSLVPNVAGVATAMTHVCSGDGLVASFTTGIDPHAGTGLQAEVYGCVREGEYASVETVNEAQTVPFMWKMRSSTWLGDAQEMATIISSPIGIVVELVNTQTQSARVLKLTRTPDDATAPVFTAAQKEDAVYLRDNGLPHVVDATETGDGRLVILLANGDVRLLEVRDQELQVDEDLWQRLVGGQSADFEEYEDSEAGGSGDDEGDGDGDGDGDEGNGEGEGEGSGSGKGNGDGTGKGQRRQTWPRRGKRGERAAI